MQNQNKPDCCDLCAQDRNLTFHHLIPRKMHRRSGFKKRYSKEQLNEGIFLCRICHSGLHKTYDEMVLAKQFNTKELILQNPALLKHINWSKQQKLSKIE